MAPLNLGGDMGEIINNVKVTLKTTMHPVNFTTRAIPYSGKPEYVQVAKTPGNLDVVTYFRDKETGTEICMQLCTSSILHYMKVHMYYYHYDKCYRHYVYDSIKDVPKKFQEQLNILLTAHNIFKSDC